jgi:DSHCT (NUC185) domain
VRGAKLEDVLDSVPGLTPGDFVRSVKQLIDLLDQIAAAASYDGSRKSSRARARTRPVSADDSAASSAPATQDVPAGPPATTEDAGTPTTEDAPAGQSVRREPPSSAPADGDADREPRRREPAPRDRDVAATARAAIDAMRRGVIAYTTLTD